MKIASISTALDKLGLPIFWQLYTAVLTIFSISVVLMSNETLLNISNIIITCMISIGVLAGINHHKHKFYPWGFLVGGVALMNISITLHSLSYFGLNTNPLVIIGIEELAILLIGLFSITFMLNFEKEFKLNGFTLDFSLIVISILSFGFFVVPNILHTIFFEITIFQQFALLNLVASIIIFSMTVINHILSNKLLMKDVARMAMILFLIMHFSFVVMKDFQLIESNTVLSRTSWSYYHLAGVLAIIFTFLEKLSIDYNRHISERMSSQFMWVASIFAIVAIPLGMIARDRMGLPPLSTLLIGITSFSLSSVVIWRLQKVIRNIDQQRSNLKKLAYTDPLTELPNYHGYLDKLSSVSTNNMLLISINIEDFKSINDLHGRDFGDKVLKSLANRLQTAPHIILSARTGSDYFHTVFKTPFKSIPALVDDIQKYLGVWDMVDNKRIAVPLTYGASHSSDFIKPEILARQAELALKTSRAEHTTFTLYSEKDNPKSKNLSLPRHELREILQKAVDDDYLPIHFQPIYDLRSGDLKAVELLIRVESKDHGLLLPGQFLDQAKSYGLLTSLTKVCINMVAKCYEQLPNVTININVPPYMLNNPQILNNFIRNFEEVNLPINRFCLELTEDGDIPTDHLIPSIKLLKTHGFRIAMDDFGTGYSSLSRLSVLPVDTVKIDRSLLLAASAGNKAILESAISLTKRLGASAVVEGVETLEQLTLIRKLGADSVQGFLFSKPVKISKASLLSLNAADIIADF